MSQMFVDHLTKGRATNSARRNAHRRYASAKKTKKIGKQKIPLRYEAGLIRLRFGVARNRLKSGEPKNLFQLFKQTSLVLISSQRLLNH
jgi:hypothetical protein